MGKITYILEYDVNHSEDPGRDAFCWNKEQVLSLPSQLRLYSNINWQFREAFIPPERLYFQANFDMIPKYDFPYTDLDTPIISKRMLNVLLGVASFEYSLIPVTMIDFTYLDNPFDDEDKLKSDVPINNDYVAIYFPDCLYNVFDHERFTYSISSVSGAYFTNKFILKDPNYNFPPVFRIKESLVPLFVSSEAKEALELNGIKGCVFEPVEVTPYEE